LTHSASFDRVTANQRLPTVFHQASQSTSYNTCAPKPRLAPSHHIIFDLYFLSVDAESVSLCHFFVAVFTPIDGP
jgi:hypothetical protein